MVRDLSQKARVQPTEEEDPETWTEPRARVCWMNPAEGEPLSRSCLLAPGQTGQGALALGCTRPLAAGSRQVRT